MAIGLAGYAMLPDRGSLDEAQRRMVACLHTTICVIGSGALPVSGGRLQVSTNRHLGERGDGRTGI